MCRKRGPRDERDTVAEIEFPISTADQTRCRGRGPGRAAVCRADEKQIECKSLRMRREPATTPAWVLSWGIEMAKTENRKPKLRCGAVLIKILMGFSNMLACI